MFTVGVVSQWNSSPREAGDAPSVEVFRARMDGALRNLFDLMPCKVSSRLSSQKSKVTGFPIFILWLSYLFSLAFLLPSFSSETPS